MTIRELVDLLNSYTRSYEQGTPQISDKGWDELYFELQKREEEEGIFYPDSPTQIIYYNIVSQLKKVKHNHLMLSLDKTKNIEDIKQFLHGQDFVAMFKMDGLTCSLTYENGILVAAETRGNGEIGEDIWHNARVIKNIPQTIPYKGTLIVDGEVICTYPDFKPFSNDYKNPRNFAAGSIRLLDSRECNKRNLSFVAWEMIEGYPEITEFWKRLAQLQEIGFTIVPMVPDAQCVKDAVEILNSDIERTIYPIDGYVFKFNDIKYGNEQGQTGHHLKNAIAFKFYDELYDTTLKYITWTMGRTGILTPVAVFEPVEIDSTIVERASLHNVSIMKELLGDCAYVGEPLQIFKANQIIPQIAKAGPKYDYSYIITHGGTPANDNIEKCPICGGDVIYITSEDKVINAYCSNPQCQGKLINRLEHFCSKKGLDIKGLSKATFEKLINWGWVNNIKDIFYLNNYRSEWIKKSGFGVASVDKILNSIEQSKNTTLAAFISALGIPLIGPIVAKALSTYFETYKDFRNAVDEHYSFASFVDFGYEMEKSLYSFDYTEADEISILLNINNNRNNLTNNSFKPLDGQTVVITGKLNHFKNRDELKECIVNWGGKVTDNITSKVSFLINNDINSISSKNQKAKQYGIPIITETEFIEKCNENQKNFFHNIIVKDKNT